MRRKQELSEPRSWWSRETEGDAKLQVRRSTLRRFRLVYAIQHVYGGREQNLPQWGGDPLLTAPVLAGASECGNRGSGPPDQIHVGPMREITLYPDDRHQKIARDGVPERSGVGERSHREYGLKARSNIGELRAPDGANQELILASWSAAMMRKGQPSSR